MASEASSAFKCLCEDLGGQAGRATQDHRNEVARYIAAVIQLKARHNGLKLEGGDVEDLVARVELRMASDITSYKAEFSFKAWITGHIVPSVLFHEKKRRERELPRIHQMIESDEQGEFENELWDMDSHKYVETFNQVEREVLSDITVEELWKICARTVSPAQLDVARRRIEEDMSSFEIAVELGKTESQINDLYYQFRKKMKPVLTKLGYNIPS